MADEKVPQGTPAPDSAEYQAEVARLMKGDAEAAKPDEPKPDEPEEPKGEEEEKPEGEEAEDEEEGEEKPPDKYTAALRKLQKEESRLQDLKATILQRDREITQREQKAQKDEQEIASFIKAIRVDPFQTLLKAGILTEDDAEYISKQLYYHSKTASVDPKNKAEADRIRREREFRLEAEENRHRIARLEKEREDERAQATQKQNLDAYVSKIDAAVEAQKSKHSLLAKALEKNPARTKQELFKIANDLSYAKQAYADPGLVILAWVKERKAFLAELGVNEPVKKQPETDKSKNPDKPRGTPDGKPASKLGQYGTPEFDQAAYDAELRRHLRGEAD